jgi:hypothetical protein
MRFRVSKKFGRVPGQHGDGYIPQYYPIPVNPGIWGGPWAKVKDEGLGAFVVFFFIPVALYVSNENYFVYKHRVVKVGKRVASHCKSQFRMMDLDDPDWDIKVAELNKEYERGETVVTWGGSNFIGSWLWEPGDPEPDRRRRAVPEGHH